jgi:hypothetical protein
MKIFLIVANLLVITLVLLCGAVYPSLKEWSYIASVIFMLHLFLELSIAYQKLLDAAKISTWAVQALSAFSSASILFPYTSLDWSGWQIILAACSTAFTILLTVVVSLVFKISGPGSR